MAEETLRSDFAYGDRVIRGATTLEAYFEELAQGAPPVSRAAWVEAAGTSMFEDANDRRCALLSAHGRLPAVN